MLAALAAIIRADEWIKTSTTDNDLINEWIDQLTLQLIHCGQFRKIGPTNRAAMHTEAKAHNYRQVEFDQKKRIAHLPSSNDVCHVLPRMHYYYYYS